MKNPKCSMVILATLAFGFSFAGNARAQLPVNLSGYEFFLGVDCFIGGQAATCGVRFGGWTGGDGAVASGWTRPPGDRDGLWDANVNYSGKAGFGNTAALLGGMWTVYFRNGITVSGAVTGGSVQWPPTSSDNIGCGTAVATVSASLNLTTGGAATFTGCLHDLPAFAVIPPKAWGSIQ